MDQMLWVFMLAAVVTLVLRGVLLRGVSPISQQTVRQLFLDRLLAAADACRVLDDTEEAVTLLCGHQTCVVHFDALYRRCLESPFYMHYYVRQAVLAIQSALADTDALPTDWQTRLVPLLVSEEVPAPSDLYLRRLTARLSIAYVLIGDDAFRWLRQADVTNLALEAEALHALALRNLERSCSALVIDTPPTLPDGRDRLLRFHTQDGLDAARALVPTFYQRFAPRFGDVDILVAIPTRDALIAIPATDPAQASFLAWRAETERRQSPHPLSAQLLRIGDGVIDEWVPGALVEAEE